MERWDDFKRKWLPTPWHAAERNKKELKILLELTGRHRAVDNTLNNTLRYIESYLFDPDAVDAASITPDLAGSWCNSQIANSRDALSNIQNVEFSFQPQNRVFAALRELQELKLNILERHAHRLQQAVRAGTYRNREIVGFTYIEYQRNLLELHKCEAQYFAASLDATKHGNPKYSILESNRLRSEILAELSKAIMAALEFDFDTAGKIIHNTPELLKCAAEQLAKASQNIRSFQAFVDKLRSTHGETGKLGDRLNSAASDFPAEVRLSQDLLDAIAAFAENISAIISQPIADEQEKLDRVAQIKSAALQIDRYSGKLSNLSDKRLQILSPS